MNPAGVPVSGRTLSVWEEEARNFLSGGALEQAAVGVGKGGSDRAKYALAIDARARLVALPPGPRRQEPFG